MEYTCEHLGISEEDEMAIKDVIIGEYRKDSTETTSQMFEAVDEWCEQNRPGRGEVRLFAWYLVGFYLGGMQAAQLFSLFEALKGARTDISSDDIPKDAW